MGSEQEKCHRRECDNEAVFFVREQYQEETGKGMVEATARLCQTHAKEESPTNLNPVTPEYLFEVTALASRAEATDAGEEITDDQRLLQCPDCGWTGSYAEVSVEDGVRSCPVCDDDIEIVK